MSRRSRSLRTSRIARVLTLLVAIASLLVAVGVERISYKWCPWMGAMWSSCCEGRHDHRASVDPVLTQRCCETRRFEALPRGEAQRTDDVATAPPAIASAPVVAILDEGFEAPPLPIVVREGVPPPRRQQQRLSQLSFLRL